MSQTSLTADLIERGLGSPPSEDTLLRIARDLDLDGDVVTRARGQGVDGSSGLPWFEYYASDVRALEGGERFGGVKRGVIRQFVAMPLGSGYGLRKDQVREGAF